ncbi:MAG: hypothetical protein AB1705_17210 [Verrucomicrobiota bacterium]
MAVILTAIIVTLVIFILRMNRQADAAIARFKVESDELSRRHSEINSRSNEEVKAQFQRMMDQPNSMIHIVMQNSANKISNSHIKEMHSDLRQFFSSYVSLRFRGAEGVDIALVGPCPSDGRFLLIGEDPGLTEYAVLPNAREIYSRSLNSVESSFTKKYPSIYHMFIERFEVWNDE